MSTSLNKHIESMLLLGKKIIKSNPLLINEVGTVNVKGDKTIGMDIEIEKALIDYIKKNDIPADIFSEEIGTLKFHPDPKYLIAFDPLDGSTNYKIGKNIYPYGLLIAIYKGTTPRLKDVVAAGAIEHTQDLAWIYHDGQTTDIQGNKIELKNDWAVDKSTPIYLDLYYKVNYLTYTPLAQKLFIRNTGSTVGNLSYVLSNIAGGMGHGRMRPEEIGAIYSLIKGAGGVVVNYDGKDLGEEKFLSDNLYQVLAGSKNIVDFEINILKNGL